MNKLIITLASLGNVPTKELNPNAPLSITEILDDIAVAEKLGVSVAHIHVRDDEGKPTSDREKFRQVLDGIESRNLKVITQVSTGARGGENTVEWRGQMLDLNAEMASLSTGSSNFPSSVNANSPDLIEALAARMYENNIKPEIEAFDLSMISNAEYLLKKGILKGPLHFNLVMNVPGSIKGTLKNLLFMVESLPKDSTWTVSGIGASQIPMITAAIIMGGHVRTGLEDVLKMPDGSLASNQGLVEQVIRIANSVGREIATPREAREILSLK